MLCFVWCEFSRFLLTYRQSNFILMSSRELGQIMRIWHALVALSLVAGCQTGGIGLPGSPAWQMSTTPEQKMAYFQQVCQGYGFQPGTSAMAQCAQNEAMSTRQSASARAAALSQYNNSLQPKPMTNTTCRNINGIINCSTW